MHFYSTVGDVVCGWSIEKGEEFLARILEQWNSFFLLFFDVVRDSYWNFGGELEIP